MKVVEPATKLQQLNKKHSIDYYLRLLMQQSRLDAKTRQPSRWNAFLSLEMERLNAGKYHAFFFPCVVV